MRGICMLEALADCAPSLARAAERSKWSAFRPAVHSNAQLPPSRRRAMSGRIYKGQVLLRSRRGHRDRRPAAHGVLPLRLGRRWAASPVSAFARWKADEVKVTAGAEHVAAFKKTPKTARKCCRFAGGHLLMDHAGVRRRLCRGTTGSRVEAARALPLSRSRASHRRLVAEEQGRARAAGGSASCYRPERASTARQRRGARQVRRRSISSRREAGLSVAIRSSTRTALLELRDARVARTTAASRSRSRRLEAIHRAAPAIQRIAVPRTDPRREHPGQDPGDRNSDPNPVVIHPRALLGGVSPDQRSARGCTRHVRAVAKGVAAEHPFISKPNFL